MIPNQADSVTENGFTQVQEEELVKISDETIKHFKAGKFKSYKSIKNLIADLCKDG